MLKKDSPIFLQNINMIARQLFLPFKKSTTFWDNPCIVPMEFRLHFFPRISAFSRRTKMHLNGMLLIGTEFFQIIVPL